MPVYTVKVPDEYNKAERLDKYIASLPDGMNRSKLKSGVTEILLNGKKSKLSQKINGGDVIDITWEDNIPDYIEPEDIPLDIIYEDENVTVVNKKQGMVTHPACGNWNGTLVNALLYHWGRESIKQIKEGSEQKILEFRRPGIVHRLDKETSGIIITAKNRDTEEFLGDQFRNKKLRKEYILIVKGRPPEKAGDIRTQIIRDPKDRKRFKAVT
ncbi:MAG: RluA family pseudouridine synthase, partial [Treponema sp.]|nr:RluA family pseudouridine synthase [Treponema sp.]